MRRVLNKMRSKRGAVNGLVVTAIITAIIIGATYIVLFGGGGSNGNNTLRKNNLQALNLVDKARVRMGNSIGCDDRNDCN